MALKKCRDCKKEISSKAKLCPNCGLGQKASSAGEVMGGCLILVIIISIAVAFCGSDEPDDSNSWMKEDKIYAYLIAESYVEKNLKAPKSAEFASTFDKPNHVSFDKESQLYTVISYVDSQNSFGAKIRSKFTAIIQRLSDKDWKLIRLNIE